MGMLKIEDVTLTEHFKSECDKHGFRLPLRLCDEAPGVVLDDTGREAFTIPLSDYDDADAANLALLMILAVNTCGGFKATLR